MRLAVTSFQGDRKILAIKGFRSSFLGADLKTAKDVMDQVGAGATVIWELPADADAQWVICNLSEHGVTAHLVDEPPPAVPAAKLVELLRGYHPSLTVGALIGMLEATEDLTRAGCLVIGGEW